MRNTSLISFLAAGLLCAAASYGALPASPFFFYVTTVAGEGKKGYLDGKGIHSRFNWPTGVAVSDEGVVYVADYSNNLIRKIDASGNVATLAGSVRAGFHDGKGKEALFWGPDNMTMDSTGNLFVADADNFSVRKITPAGAVTTVAGSAVAGLRDGPSAEAMFGYPTGIAVDGRGVLYVADRRAHAIRKIIPTPDGGRVVTVAGGRGAGYADGKGAGSLFREPVSLAVTPGGVLYVADSGNNAIRKITPDSTVTTIAGASMPGYRDGSGKEAFFSWPTGMALDSRGNIYVCDSNNNKIRRITPEGIVSTAAGELLPGSLDGWGLKSGFNFPTAVAVDRAGNIYVADSGNNKIRKITYGESKEVNRPLSNPEGIAALLW
ncbi:MAG: SMP-30/gluconolactonase/LRE family protein [Deltaproteobacteria bacterium]|nr:SMP-30/gluconolactonase/LRE family protein [Deltaproteobacteria bacterium]